MSTCTTQSRRTGLKANLARAGVVAASLTLVGGLIVTQSQAAFTTTTTNSGNAFNAATIELSGADTDGARFNLATHGALVPGSVVNGCIEVTYTGSADPAGVKLYRSAYAETEGGSGGATLDDALTFAINKVDDCLAKLNPVALNVGDGKLLGGLNKLNWADAVDASWDPAAAPGGVKVGYDITATFTPSGTNATDNTRIGDTVTGLSFTWETQVGTPGA